MAGFMAFKVLDDPLKTFKDFELSLEFSRHQAPGQLGRLFKSHQGPDTLPWPYKFVKALMAIKLLKSSQVSETVLSVH